MKQFLVIILILTCFNSFAVTVKGKVIDAKTNEVIPFVNVYIEGLNRGTTSNLNGDFSIEVKDGESLVFSYIGYLNAKIVKNNSLEGTLDLGNIILFSWNDNQKKHKKKKKLFKRKKQIDYDCLMIVGGVEEIKDEELIVKCPNGTVSYIWERRKEDNTLSVDFKKIKNCMP